MNAFGDAVLKYVLDQAIDVPVYTVIPADPAREHVFISQVGGGPIDPRFHGVIATVRVDTVARSYRRAYELTEQVQEAFLAAESRCEKTPDGYFQYLRVYEPPKRWQSPRAPEDEWRFTALYGVVIS